MAVYKDVKSRKAVFAAMAECRHFGREAFRKHYGFEEANTYVMRWEGFEYDSKPIIAVAHKYQFPDEGALKNDFSGGKGHAAGHLARLGFPVDGVMLGQSDWRLDEVQAIVEEYFDMMQAAADGNLNKSARFRALEERLVGRNQSSLSRKCSNISAVLDGLGLPWLEGFRPLPNVQTLLEAVIIDAIDDRPHVVEASVAASADFSAFAGLEVSPPSRTVLKSVEHSRRACRVDYAARDERNRALGRAGEEWAVRYFEATLTSAGRRDLADRIEWVSQSQGDGLGYDIAAFDLDGLPIFVEVKATNGAIGAPFVLTSNELAVSRELGSAFRLMRIFNFSSSPRFYFLKGDLAACCDLTPQVYRATPYS